MEGLDILGAMDGFSKPKKGAVIGSGAGALVGALLAAFTGKVVGRGLFGSRAALPFMRKLVPRAVKIATGAVVGGAAGAGLGFGVGKAIEHRENAALAAAKPAKPGLPGVPGMPGALPKKAA